MHWGKYKRCIEAGCDEAGRGCLAGPVFAAAVILKPDFFNPLIDDSKKLTPLQREKMRRVIESESVSWAVASVDNETIDRINILQASILAMHRAVDRLEKKPQLLLIDGNRFKKYKKIPHRCIVNGDATYSAIAAASILAKTHRDEYILRIHSEYPLYGWDKNKCYPTQQHREAIRLLGITKYHRKSFTLRYKT